MSSVCADEEESLSERFSFTHLQSQSYKTCKSGSPSVLRLCLQEVAVDEWPEAAGIVSKAV